MEANLPHLPNYNPEAPTCELRYLDARALYSYCLCRPLPIGGYKWLTNKQVDEFDVWAIPIKSDYGYVLECNLRIPAHLHDFLRDFPPLPEHTTPLPEMWTAYQHDLAEQTGQPKKNSTTKKLIGHLGPRKNYALHLEHLKCCLKLGIELTKIHRIIRFKQTPWAREYIEHLMKKRAMSKTAFENMYFKRMSNVIYGYLLQNVRKRVNTTLVTSSVQFLKHSRKPNFSQWNIYGKHLASVEMKPMSIMLNNLVGPGYCVLELSKTHLLKFWYFFLKPRYGDNCVLLATDTDSLIVAVIDADENMNEMMWNNRRYFDMSGFPPPYASNTNKQKAGTMKCELSGQDEIVAFCGLRAKSYCLKKKSDKIDQKSKGIPYHMSRELKFQDYIEALNEPMNRNINKVTYQSIRSIKQKMYTIEESKTSLCAFDDKRILLPDRKYTVPYFYCGEQWKHLLVMKDDDQKPIDQKQTVANESTAELSN